MHENDVRKPYAYLKPEIIVHVAAAVHGIVVNRACLKFYFSLAVALRLRDVLRE